MKECFSYPINLNNEGDSYGDVCVYTSKECNNEIFKESNPCKVGRIVADVLKVHTGVFTSAKNYYQKNYNQDLSYRVDDLSLLDGSEDLFNNEVVLLIFFHDSGRLSRVSTTYQLKDLREDSFVLEETYGNKDYNVVNIF